MPDPIHGRLDLWAQVMGIAWPEQEAPSAQALERDVEFQEESLEIPEADPAAPAAGYRWRVLWARRRGAEG